MVNIIELVTIKNCFLFDRHYNILGEKICFLLENVSKLLEYFFFKKKSAILVPEQVAQSQPVFQDTIKKIDSATLTGADTMAGTTNPEHPVSTDSFNFKIVIREYKDAATAEKKLKIFTENGYKLILIKVDSTKYQLAMPFTTPLADTLRAKDSLQKKIFGGNPYVILK